MSERPTPPPVPEVCSLCSCSTGKMVPINHVPLTLPKCDSCKQYEENYYEFQRDSRHMPTEIREQFDADDSYYAEQRRQARAQVQPPTASRCCVNPAYYLDVRFVDEDDPAETLPAHWDENLGRWVIIGADVDAVYERHDDGSREMREDEHFGCITCGAEVPAYYI